MSRACVWWWLMLFWLSCLEIIPTSISCCGLLRVSREVSMLCLRYAAPKRGFYGNDDSLMELWCVCVFSQVSVKRLPLLSSRYPVLVSFSSATFALYPSHFLSSFFSCLGHSALYAWTISVPIPCSFDRSMQNAKLLNLRSELAESHFPCKRCTL